MSSKNNPNNRKGTGTIKMVTSYDCESCKNKCEKGMNYLSIFSKRKVGNGVVCEFK